MSSKLSVESDGQRSWVRLDDKSVPHVTKISWDHQSPHEVPRVSLHLNLALVPIRASGELASLQDQHGRKIRRIEFEDGSELVAEDTRQPVDGEPPAA